MRTWSEDEVRRAMERAFEDVRDDDNDILNPFTHPVVIPLIRAWVRGTQTLLNQQASEFVAYVRETIFANGTLENVNAEMIERATELLGGIAVRRIAADKNKIGSGG